MLSTSKLYLLIYVIYIIYQFKLFVYVVHQEAIAIGFETESKRINTPECYWNELPLELLPKRDKMAAFLTEVGMIPTIPEAGYFMVADISNLSQYHNYIWL